MAPRIRSNAFEASGLADAVSVNEFSTADLDAVL
jgi:hypothetical protein